MKFDLRNPRGIMILSQILSKAIIPNLDSHNRTLILLPLLTFRSGHSASKPRGEIQIIQHCRRLSISGLINLSFANWTLQVSLCMCLLLTNKAYNLTSKGVELHGILPLALGAACSMCSKASWSDFSVLMRLLLDHSCLPLPDCYALSCS